ncbi:MAG: ATP synthase F0 subunit B [Desulfobacter sp.]|nr:ATP synthase F0 subunit B [Desulfobacter sp.]WDP86735.1 MAG: ATP synthase F0 subunit B [Desulfobacter sp.]
MITVIPDISAVYQMINFLVLLFVLNMVLYKPIRNVLLERKAKVENLEGGVEKASADLDSGIDAYKNGLKQARGEGLQKKEAFIEEASVQEKEIIDQINKKAQANFAKIKQQVAEEAEQAQKALEAEVDAYAKAIGEKILGRAC